MIASNDSNCGCQSRCQKPPIVNSREGLVIYVAKKGPSSSRGKKGSEFGALDGDAIFKDRIT